MSAGPYYFKVEVVLDDVKSLDDAMKQAQEILDGIGDGVLSWSLEDDVKRRTGSPVLLDLDADEFPALQENVLIAPNVGKPFGQLNKDELLAAINLAKEASKAWPPRKQR